MSENTESELADGGQWPKLTVRNFGPIAKGEVELRPLTVFVGPSNTGKSWLATLIYALGRCVNASYGPRGFRSRRRFRRIDSDGNGLENFPENPTAWLQSLRKDGTLSLTKSDKQALKSILDDEEEVLQEEILRCFGLTEARHLVREGKTGPTSVIFMNTATADPFATRQYLTVTKEGRFSLDVDVMTDECRPPSTKHFMSILEHLDADPDESYLKAELFDLLVGDHRRYPSTYYLPADRGGVMHAHQVVVGALIQSASRAGLIHRSPLPTLSGVLADFLEQMLTLTTSRVPRYRRPQIAPAVSLEQNVLGGEIRVKKSSAINYPHFTYRPDGWQRDLSLMSVSSMVSELAPVALYLHRCVRQKDLLILEEPEAHLHPAMQVRLVREIAGWVRQGIRVLITTHSEWVLEEIANLVAASEGEKKDSLKKQDVGMWLFKPNRRRPSGSHIREIEWSVDEGGYASDFDDVAMELHNEWAGLVDEVE